MNREGVREVVDTAKPLYTSVVSVFGCIGGFRIMGVTKIRSDRTKNNIP